MPDSFICNISDVIASLCIKSIHIFKIPSTLNHITIVFDHPSEHYAFPIHKRNYFQIFFCKNKVTYSLLFDLSNKTVKAERMHVYHFASYAGYVSTRLFVLSQTSYMFGIKSKFIFHSFIEIRVLSSYNRICF